MKVKDLRLHTTKWPIHNTIRIEDQYGNPLFRIRWGTPFRYTKLQAIAIAKRLCDSFNAGQEKK